MAATLRSSYPCVSSSLFRLSAPLSDTPDRHTQLIRRPRHPSRRSVSSTCRSATPHCRIRGDFYEVVIERHRRASTIVTSNRSIEEWIPLFDDPVLAQSALDRLAHNAYQVVIEGDSYRSRQKPGSTPPPPSRRKRK